MGVQEEVTLSWQPETLVKSHSLAASPQSYEISPASLPRPAQSRFPGKVPLRLHPPLNIYRSVNQTEREVLIQRITLQLLGRHSPEFLDFCNLIQKAGVGSHFCNAMN